MLWFFETDYWFLFICRQDRSMFLVIFHIFYLFSNVLLWYLILVFLSWRSYQVYILWRTWFDVCVQVLYSLWRLHVNWFGTDFESRICLSWKRISTQDPLGVGSYHEQWCIHEVSRLLMSFSVYSITCLVF